MRSAFSDTLVLLDLVQCDYVTFGVYMVRALMVMLVRLAVLL